MLSPRFFLNSENIEEKNRRQPMRVSDGAKALGIEVIEAKTEKKVFRVKDIFTTYQGSWENKASVYSPPSWAKDEYLKPTGHPQQFDEAGGDRHIFTRVEFQGAPLATLVSTYTKDAKNRETRSTGEKRSGWQNRPITGSFLPEKGEKGYWCAKPGSPEDAADEVWGMGLPNNHHVSSFIVWELMENGTGEKPPVGLQVTIRELKELQHVLYYGDHL